MSRLTHAITLIGIAAGSLSAGSWLRTGNFAWAAIALVLVVANAMWADFFYCELERER